LGAPLRADGTIVNIVSSPDIYLHEWASFTTELADTSPAVDILCPDESYRDVYASADLRVADVLKPLATCVIYVLKPGSA